MFNYLLGGKTKPYNLAWIANYNSVWWNTSADYTSCSDLTPTSKHCT